MAEIIETATLDRSTLDVDTALWVYNGYDCCITYEVFEAMLPKIPQYAQVTYDFERAMQAPALDIMLRGVLIDQQEKYNNIREQELIVSRLESILSRYAEAAWGRPLNPNSPKQVAEFFYGYMKLPEIWKKNKQTGVRSLATDREALEKLSIYFYAKPFVNLISAIKDAKKKISSLKSGVDKDGRLRVSYSVAGTETGRWSSSKNCFGGGFNFQNLTEALRGMVIADPGMKLAYVDLEQAESRGVAYLSGDEDYIAACEGGDLHTTVCRMVWKHLGWTGELKYDKNEIASQIFYLHFSYRDMAKRGGHGTNYYGTPYTMARHLKVSTEVMEDFQSDYFSAFPGIPAWHQNIAERLQTEHAITTPLGRRRIFFGRANDDSTLREAIAFEPQSTIGDSLNLGLWRVWKYAPWIQLLGQVHDAILFQYPEEREAEALELVSKLLLVDILVHGRILRIPNEAQTGWNWKHWDHKNPEENPDGLITWKGSDDRIRSRKAKTSVLDIRLS